MDDFNKQLELGKEKFYLFSQIFFENEIMREIYEGESFSICNILDRGYFFFDFLAIQYNNIIPSGVGFNKETMEEIINKPDVYYLDILKNVSEDYFKTNSIVLDENTFNVLQQRKIDFYGKPPSINISHEWEDKIKARNNKKSGGLK